MMNYFISFQFISPLQLQLTAHFRYHQLIAWQNIQTWIHSIVLMQLYVVPMAVFEHIIMPAPSTCLSRSFNTLRPRQNGRHFADDSFKCIFLNENVWIPIKISLKFVPKGPINNIPALVQIMAWRRPGDKPLSETMMVRLLTHICVTRPQWVKSNISW